MAVHDEMSESEEVSCESDAGGFDTGSESELSESDKQLQEAFARNEIDSGSLHCLVPFVRKDLINNVDGLKENFERIRLNLPWVERFDLINDLAPVAPELAAHLKEGVVEDVREDDFKREVILQAQASVLEVIPRLKKLGIPTKRPDDYFAQMLKSDDHMHKVREVLVSKNLAMERREKVRKLRELRKYGKKVQTEVMQQRAKEKREMMESVKKFRKGQKNKLDFLELNDDEPEKLNQKSVKGKKGQKKNKGKSVNGKHDAKAEKYGFGGKKKRAKYNDAKSSAEFDDFGSKNSKMRGKNKKFGSARKQGKSRRRGKK